MQNINKVHTIVECFSSNRSVHNKDNHIDLEEKNSYTLPEKNAAIIIQKHIRIYLEKKGIMSNNLLLKYKILCINKPKNIFSTMARAKDGNTTVFLPENFPEVVFKQSSKDPGEIRLRKMQEVRAILLEQKSSCLIVPKAIRFGDFLVEDRLPINTNTLHNMALYISHASLFDNAVREMTRFFSEKFLSDIITYSSINPLAHLSGVNDHVRYDNIPLFIIESQGIKKGAVGLIDLEHISERKDEESLKDLARVFPLHLNIIKQEANYLQMSYNDSELDVMATKGKKYLQKGYSDFLNWLKKKGIENNSKNWKFEIKSEREKTIRPLLELEILKLNAGINDLYTRYSKYYGKTKPPKYFLKENVQETAQKLSDEIAPVIIKDIVDIINEYIISNNLEHSSITASKLDDPMMVILRAIKIPRRNFFSNTIKRIYENSSIKQEQLPTYMDIADIAEQLVHIIFENLVEAGEIFHYNPGYYTEGHSLSWIRF